MIHKILLSVLLIISGYSQLFGANITSCSSQNLYDTQIASAEPGKVKGVKTALFQGDAGEHEEEDKNKNLSILKK